MRNILTKIHDQFCKRDYFRLPHINENDIFLVSYPRSGNTWVRFILFYLFFPNREISSLEEAKNIFTGKKVKREAEVTIVKSHRSYPFRHEKDKPNYYKKVIYVIRNPYDAIKSYYTWMKALNKRFDLDFAEFVFRCNHGMIGPCSWREHVLSWYGASKNNQTLFVKYEDLQKNSEIQIKRLADFVKIDVTNEQIKNIQKKTSIEAMRKLENNGSPFKGKYDFIRKEDSRKVEINFEKEQELKNLVIEYNNIAYDIWKEM